MSLIDFFFFQAEDGIRDATVTGVQTCALPISGALASGSEESRRGPGNSEGRSAHRRSEERRVGKECRSRWSPFHSRKKRKHDSLLHGVKVFFFEVGFRLVAKSEVVPLVAFFFFQVEDGIRVATVTGVQTCALPISLLAAWQGSLSCWGHSWPSRRGSGSQ